MIANENQHTVNFQKIDGTSVNSIRDINQVRNRDSPESIQKFHLLNKIIFRIRKREKMVFYIQQEKSNILLMLPNQKVSLYC